MTKEQEKKSRFLEWVKTHKAITAIILFLVIALFLPDIENENSPTAPLEQDAITAPLEQDAIILDDEEIYKVTRIIDGDTLEIETGEKVRLICIDTPEKDEEYYQEAKDRLSELALGKEVLLVQDKSEKDRYGRLLRYIYLDEAFVNLILVEEGFAKAYPYAPDTTLCHELEEGENQAKQNKIGIWKETPLNEENSQEEPKTQETNSDCFLNKYNCGDFTKQSQAQEIYDLCVSLGKGDIHQLDRDKDEVACEALP